MNKRKCVLVQKLEYYYRMREGGYFNSEKEIEELEKELLEILKKEQESK